MRSSTGWLVGALFLGACGGSDDPAPPAVPAPTEPANVTERLPPPVEPAVVASPTSATTAAPEVTAPGPRPDAPTAGPAFVVYTYRPDAPVSRRLTVIVPLSSSVPARSLEGTVVLDDASGDPQLSWLAGADDVPWPCACACETGEPLPDEGLTVSLDTRSFEAVGDAGDCYVPPQAPACAGDVPDDEDDDEVDDDDEEGDGEDEDEGDCSSAGLPASLVGGNLFVPLDTHEGCEGWNIYGSDLRTLTLTRDEWTAPALPSTGVSCEPDASTGGWPDLRAQSAPLRCSRGRTRWRGDGVDCEWCDIDPSGTVVARISRGRLQLFDVTVTSGGTGILWMAESRLSRESCPSSADPCGNPARFPDLASLAGGADFWVATDGSAALALTPDAHGRGTLQLFAQGSAGASRALPVPIVPRDVLGVRFHRDVGLLARLVDHGLPAPHARACAAAQAQGPEVAPSAAATARATMAPAPTSAAAPTSACEPGQRRAGSGTCEPLPLAPSDVGFVDTRGGSDWGNRCALHLRAGELDAAEAACAAGLAAAARDTTRGALFYNLGRIAEARGDRATARERYRRSLELRPANAAVQSALEALGE